MELRGVVHGVRGRVVAFLCGCDMLRASAMVVLRLFLVVG